MSNRYRPHVIILPEDDANRQLVLGFLLHPGVRQRQVGLLRVAGGWAKARDRLVSDHVGEMERTPHQHVVLLIDFDNDLGRLDEFRKHIPATVADRVYIIGSRSRPEALKKELGTFEAIGRQMANDCFEGSGGIWSHQLLNHNEPELKRLRAAACRIIFGE
jgi:hypothetical protein